MGSEMKSHRFEDVEIYVDGVRLVPARGSGSPTAFMIAHAVAQRVHAVYRSGVLGPPPRGPMRTRVLRISKGRRAMGTPGARIQCPVWRLRWSSWLRRYRLRFRAGARDIWVGIDWVGGRWMAVGLGGGPE